MSRARQREPEKSKKAVGGGPPSPWLGGEAGSKASGRNARELPPGAAGGSEVAERVVA